jgi:hypothetical protein
LVSLFILVFICVKKKGQTKTYLKSKLNTTFIIEKNLINQIFHITILPSPPW